MGRGRALGNLRRCWIRASLIGWTGAIARAMPLFATTTAEQGMELGKVAGIAKVEPARHGPREEVPSRKR